MASALLGDGIEPMAFLPSLDKWPTWRMNRTIKDATIKRRREGDSEQPCAQLETFAHADTAARYLKTFDDLTPDDFICCWSTTPPERLSEDPIRQIAGRYS